MDITNLAIEECAWENVRLIALKSEPELVSIIDALSPGKNYPLYKITYPFGAKIYTKGILHIPSRDKRLLPITDKNVPPTLQERLGYNALPLGFFWGHGVEVYSELEDRIFSLAYFTKGLQLGVWELFAPASPFTVSAGARSLYMLPKVTQLSSHKELKRFGVKSPTPKNPFNQWPIFKEAAQHPDFYSPWSCEIYFFSAAWLTNLKSDAAWKDFYNLLLQRAWQHTEYGRNKVMFDTVWESFSRLLTQKRIKPNSYIVDTLKHLIFVVMGALPACKPATDNQAAPVDGLLKMYLEDYALKTYAPTLMQPYHFSVDEPENPVYYSLQVPTYLESIPKYRTPSSARIDLAELSELAQQFMSELATGNILKNSTYHTQQLFSKVQFNYFHSEADLANNIRPASEMAIEDKNLLYLPRGHYAKRKFCERSSFARGCIRISALRNN